MENSNHSKGSEKKREKWMVDFLRANRKVNLKTISIELLKYLRFVEFNYCIKFNYSKSKMQWIRD